MDSAPDSDMIEISGAQALVSGLLLTIGESTSLEAHRALQRQNSPLHEIVVIENVHPFSKAFNQGVAKIETPFFIQCDADMILDENCVEVLLSKMTPQTGMVIGNLWDPLQGIVRGVKLYRTQCCKLLPMEDSSDCEEIFRSQLLKQDWLVTIESPNATLGRHDPDQRDSIYQFERFKFMGVKIRARRAWYDFAYRLLHLVRSRSPEIVPMAISAMICGYHLVHKSDHLTGFTPSREYHLWIEWSAKPDSSIQIGNKFRTFWPFPLFLGYRDGRRNSGKLKMDFIQQCLDSDQISRWAYFLGFVSAAMNDSETITQNCVTRTVRLIPFLRYLRKRLSYHIHSLQSEQ